MTDFVIDNNVLKEYKGSDTIVNIPYGITVIGEYAFKGNMFMKEVIIPNSVIVIKHGAFHNCNLIKLEIPSSVKEIENSAFCDCCLLEEVIISEGLEVIEDDVFSCCSSIKELTIPKSVKRIGSGVFTHCSSLKEVKILGDYTHVCGDTFSMCPRLQAIVSCPMQIGSFNEEVQNAAIIGYIKGLSEGIDFPPEVVDRNDKYISNNLNKVKYLGNNNLLVMKYLERSC